MGSWQSGDVESNGIRLHYTRTGGAKPPLVLAHGVTDNGLCWSPVATALEDDYDVIMVDARGHGGSSAPERGYGADEQAKDLAGLIAALDLRRPVVLGHSMGAVTTLALAGLFPAVPGAILLEDPPPWWMLPAELPPGNERHDGMEQWLTGLKRQSRDAIIAGQRAAEPGWSEAELGPWADSKLACSLNVLQLFDPATPTSVDWRAILPRITCPALLITADPERGAATGPDDAAGLRALVPQLEVARIDGAGHSIRRDRFEPYLAAVRRFLASVKPGAA